MADNTQSSVALAPLSMIAHPDSQKHSDINVASWLSGRVTIFMANIETTANVDGVTFRVQGRGNFKNDHWADVVVITTSTTASGAAIGINASEPIGETSIAMDSDPTTVILVTTECYVRNTNDGSPSSATAELGPTESEGEFHIVSDSVASIVTLTDGLENAKDALDEIVPDAEVFAFDIPDLGGFNQLRLLVEHRGATGSNIHYIALLEAATDFA